MCFAPQRRALFRHFFDIWTSKSGPRPSVFNTFDLEMCFAPQRRALFRHLNFQKWSENGVFCTFWLGNVLRATTACTFSTSQLPKAVRTLRCFVHFDLEMCFAPQRRALFRHLNFQKRSDTEVFCTFWLGNVLRATTACTFSTSQLPKVVRECVFCTFSLRNVLRATTACNFSSLIWPAGSAPAALASLLSTHRSHKSLEKHRCFATFLPFRASASSFFWSCLFWLFSPLLFNCPYCRKFHF